MTLVVADTTPLNYLVLIGLEKLLARLFDFVVIPSEVHGELLVAKAPEAVSQWARSLPPWVCVQSCGGTPETELDPGEEAAILLACELKASLVLMDERRGRLKAREKGLGVVGTVGVLIRAAENGWVDLDDALDRLEATSANVAHEILARGRRVAEKLRQMNERLERP